MRGEFCVLVEGSTEEAISEAAWWESLTVEEHVEYYIEEKGLSSKEAIKVVTKDRNMSKRDVYQAYHVEKK